MGIHTSELGRMDFTAHEQYVLRYSELGKPIPVESETCARMIKEDLIEPTDKPDVYALTERGRLACYIHRQQIDATVDR